MTNKEKWQDRRKVIIRWGLGTGAAVVAVVLLAVLIQPSVRENSLRLATVDTGSIEFAVSATGKVVPGYEEVINSPISSRVVEVYKRAGEVVQAGEPLLRLDLAAVQTEYDNMLDEEQMKELQLEKLRITNRNNITEMEMNIVGETDQFMLPVTRELYPLLFDPVLHFLAVEGIVLGLLFIMVTVAAAVPVLLALRQLPVEGLRDE